MKLSDLLKERFKVETRTNINPLVSSVGATATRVLPENPNRVAWIVINLSVNTVYLGLKNDVSASKGIALSGGGGLASMVFDEDFEMVGYEVYGIAPAGDSNIYVLETEIVNP
jgi:hypothetical protein